MSAEFKVIGYYFPGPEGIELQLDKVDFSVLTHVNYSFAIPTLDGHLRPIDHPELVRELVEYTHKHHKKISLAVGGWSWEDVPLEATFVQATDSQEKIEQLGDDIINMCLEYDFDGIDIDWEHPRWKSGTYKQYEALILYLSERLHKQGKYLTSAVLSGLQWNGVLWEDSAAHTDKVFEAVDWLNVMTYDGGEGDKHSTYDFAVNCINYWRYHRGLPKEKVVMGVPFYSYIPPRSYEALLEADADAWKKDMVVVDGQEFHYNGTLTMQKKVDYALEHCGGVMFWETTADTSKKEYSLLHTIGRRIKKSC